MENAFAIPESLQGSQIVTLDGCRWRATKRTNYTMAVERYYIDWLREKVAA